MIRSSPPIALTGVAELHAPHGAHVTPAPEQEAAPAVTVRERVRPLRIVGHAELDPFAIAPHPLNWREHPPPQRIALDGSLDEFGWIRSVLVNRRTGHLIDGHLRLAAAQESGEPTVPVEFIDVTEDEERAILASLDPITGMATANAARYQELVQGLEVHNQALAGLLQNLAQTGGASPSANLDAVPDDEPDPITRPGDLWLLGPHRLICGDCRDPEAVARVTQGVDAELVVTDPPYCSGGFQEAGRAAGTWGKIASDNLSTRGYLALLKDTFLAVRPQAAYVFTDWRMWINLYDVLEASGIAVRSMLVWAKDSPGLGSLWRAQHELIAFGSRQSAKRVKGEPAFGNVLRAERTGNVNHYTEKPVGLIAQLLQGDRVSGRSDCPVLDPFAGSGTTLIAAHSLGRTCHAIEIEPAFCDVTVRRYEQATGEKAELEPRT